MGARKLSYYKEIAPKKMALISKENTGNFSENSSKNCLDYFPYGMLLPNRHEAGNEYRYGYQGSEKDDEIKGEGNSYTTHFRQLDPRVVRWLSIDPKATAWESPYVSMGNNPVWYNDVLGDTLKSRGFFGIGKTLTHIDGKVYNKNGTEYNGKLRGIHKDVQERSRILKEGETGAKLISDIEQSKHTTTVSRGIIFKNSTKYKNPKSSQVEGVGSDSRIKLGRKGYIDAPKFIIFGHELTHALHASKGVIDRNPWYNSYGYSVIDREEQNAVYTENKIRAEHDMNLRLYYNADFPESQTIKDGKSTGNDNFNYSTLYSPEFKNLLNIIELIYISIP